MKRKRWLVIAPWVIASVLALLLAAGASAHPKGTYVYNLHGHTVPQLTCADPKCKARVNLKNDSAVNMVCYTDAAWFTGNYSSNRWFWVGWYDPAVNAVRLGYVHSSYVYNQTRVPKCNFTAAATDPSNDGSVARRLQSHSRSSGNTIVWNNSHTWVPTAIFAGGDAYDWLKNGTHVNMLCYRDLSYSTTGNYKSNRWFWVSTNGVKRWIHSSYAYYQTKVGRC